MTLHKLQQSQLFTARPETRSPGAELKKSLQKQHVKTGAHPKTGFSQENVLAQANAADLDQLLWLQGMRLWATLRRAKCPTQIFSGLVLQDNSRHVELRLPTCCGFWADPSLRSTEIWGGTRTWLWISSPRFLGWFCLFFSEIHLQRHIVKHVPPAPQTISWK